jgi:hypothetical protein
MSHESIPDPSDQIDPSPEEINEAFYNVADQMGDAESLGVGDRPIEDTTKELEAEGWRCCGPFSGEVIYEAVAEGKEIQIVGTGTQRYIFERVKASKK